MKPVKMSYEEWSNLKQQKEDEAIAIAAAQADMTVNDFLDDDQECWIISDNSRPCVYDPFFKGHRAFGKKIKIRKLPKSFRTFFRLTSDITHISPLGCPNLTMKVTVDCFAKVDEEYFHTTHKVGKCPWKEATF